MLTMPMKEYINMDMGRSSFTIHQVINKQSARNYEGEKSASLLVWNLSRGKGGQRGEVIEPQDELCVSQRCM